MEEFRQYKGDYQISNLGNMKSLKFGKERILKPHSDKDGYLRVNIFVDGERINDVYLHRAVAETFIPNPEKLRTVNHKNHDRTDNRVENLEWMSIEDNVKDGTKKPVRCYKKKTGEFIKEFPSQIEAETELGIAKGSISPCLRGRRKSAGGYKWSYVYAN